MRNSLEKLPLYVLLDCSNLLDQLLLVSEMTKSCPQERRLMLKGWVDAQNIFAEIHYESHPTSRKRAAIGVKLLTYLSWP